MIIRKLLSKKSRRRIVTLSVAASLLMSAFYITPVNNTAFVYAADEGTTSETGKDTEDKKEEDTEFDLSTTRIAFYEWKKVTTDNVRSILVDGKPHLSMIIPVYPYKVFKAADDSFYNLWGLTKDDSWKTCIPDYKDSHSFQRSNNELLNEGTINFVAYSRFTSNHGMTFFSTYADTDHAFVSTDRDDHHSEYQNTFQQVPYPPNNDKSPVPYSYYKYWNKSSGGASHSPSYFSCVERTLFLDEDYDYGDGYYATGGEGYPVVLGNDRFFSYKDSSMGLPFIRNIQMSDSNDKIAVDFIIEDKELSAGEVRNFNATNKNWYLMSHVYDGEPALYMRHQESVKQDHLYMVCPYSENGGVGKKGKNYDVWSIVSFNNSLENENNFDGWGKGLLVEDTDFSLLTFMPDDDHYKYEWIMSSSMKQQGTAHYMWYVGTPHVFTAIDSQTLKDGDFYPFKAGTFVNTSNTGDFSEGVMLPKGKTLTIDGGIVSVECNFINNGTIKITNGGTLIIKNGGSISPYTKNCTGSIVCENGSIIVMEGGKLYCVDSSSEGTTNTSKGAVLKLDKGGSLINYGRVIATTAQIGNGSKFENRKNGKFTVGMYRSDLFQLLYESNISTDSSGEIKSMSGMSFATAAWDIETLEEARDAGYIKDYSYEVKLEGNLYEFEYNITLKDGSSVGMLVRSNGSGADDNPSGIKVDGDIFEAAERMVVESLMSSGLVSADNGSQTGVMGVSGNRPCVYVEKTATFQHTNRRGEDYAATTEIIVPKY